MDNQSRAAENNSTTKTTEQNSAPISLPGRNLPLSSPIFAMAKEQNLINKINNVTNNININSNSIQPGPEIFKNLKLNPLKIIADLLLKLGNKQNLRSVATDNIH